MNSFDNINTLNIVAATIKELEPTIYCEAVDEFDCPRIRIDNDDVVWNSTLYDRGVIRLFEILAQHGYNPILYLRENDCILNIIINGETVSSGSCTPGVAAMGAFYAISVLMNKNTRTT